MPERRVLGDPVHDRRHLGHHPAVQPALRAERAGVDELEARLELPAGAHERDHEVQVRRLLADAGEHLELEREQVGLAHVAVAAAVPDHRVAPRPARSSRRPSRSAELVAAEVDRPVDDRPGRERAGDAQQRRRPCGRRTRARVPPRAAGAGARPPSASVSMNSARSSPTPSTGSAATRSAWSAHREVHVELRRERLRRPARRPARARSTLADVSAVGRSTAATSPSNTAPLRAVDGDGLAVVQHLGGAAGADDARHAELAADDRGVTGHAAAVGHERAARAA